MPDRKTANEEVRKASKIYFRLLRVVARRKAEAEAAAAAAAAAAQEAGQTAAQVDSPVLHRERSSSSLTDLEDVDGGDDAEAPIDLKEASAAVESEERRATRRKSSKKDSRPAIQRKPSRLLPKRNPTSGSVKSDAKKDEKPLPAGFILQIGAGSRNTQNKGDRLRKENVMGDPPEVDETGLMEDGTLGTYILL